jgi:hypothetical protein
MKMIQRLVYTLIVGLLAQAHGQVIFHDTMQSTNTVNNAADLAVRQASGLVQSTWLINTGGDRVDNGWDMDDWDNDGEWALRLKAYKPTTGTSWTAGRVSTDLSSHLAGKSYEITWDAQLRISGVTPGDYDPDIAFGIMNDHGATVTPMTSNTIFGIQLDGSGGGYSVYSYGMQLTSVSSDSTLGWLERFTLRLFVNEEASTVRLLLQGVGDSSPVDLGTYSVDFSGSTGRELQMYTSQTVVSGESGGGLTAHFFEVDVSLGIPSSYFHDTFQAGDDTAPNSDYELRQTNGIVTSSWILNRGAEPEANYHRILDLYGDDGIDETAMSLGVHNPLTNGATSWAATRMGGFSSLLTGASYAISLDVQLCNGGGNPMGNDSDFGVGILGSTGPNVTPLTAEAIFGVRLDAKGGGFDIYSNGTNLYSAVSGSGFDYISVSGRTDRVDLMLYVNEGASTVQVLLREGSTTNNLGTYAVDFGTGLERVIQLYSSQTENGSGSGGALVAQVSEMDVSAWTPPSYATAYQAWANFYALVNGPEGDDDLDGLANLYEYGLGGNPSDPQDKGHSPESGIVSDSGTNWFVYVYPMMSDINSGLSYSIELTDDLVDGIWTHVGYEVLGTGTDAFASGFDAVTNRVSTQDDPSQFIRLIINED